jgi:hypothetical protein
MPAPVINRQRLEFAATGFLAEMRRQHAKLFPEHVCPILTLGEYGPADRAALMAGIEKAIQLADGSADGAFAAWTERKATTQDPLTT